MGKEVLTLFYFKYKLIIYPILVALASIILIILVLLPQIRGYFSDREDERLAKSSLKNLEVKALELESISDSDLKRRLQGAVVTLPSEKDYTSIIGLLQRLGVSSGVNLTSVSLDTGKGRDIGGVSSFAVKVDIIASKFSFDEFLQKVEKAPILMRVVGMSVDTALSSSLSSQLLIDVYYSPTPKSLGSVDDPLPKLTPEEEKLADELASNIAAVPVTTTVTVSTTSEQTPITLVPRGKSNPFE